MKINMETLPHVTQIYGTCGNYWVDEAGTIQISVSETGNDDFNWLVFLHEAIVQKLSQHRGMKLTDKEHLLAAGIEKIMASLLDLDWNKYENTISEIT